MEFMKTEYDVKDLLFLVSDLPFALGNTTLETPGSLSGSEYL